MNIVFYLVLPHVLMQYTPHCGVYVHWRSRNNADKEDVAYQKANHHPFIFPHFPDQKQRHGITTSCPGDKPDNI
jgi:hypothetical protein